jgi:hypothetical protein
MTGNPDTDSTQGPNYKWSNNLQGIGVGTDLGTGSYRVNARYYCLSGNCANWANSPKNIVADPKTFICPQ